MKIPVYQTQVNPQTPQTARADAPAPVAAASGAQEAAAAKGLGRSLRQAAQVHTQLQRRELERRSLQHAAQLYLDYKKDTDALLHAQYEDDGGEVKPGLLMRRGEGARGAAQDYTLAAAKLREKYTGAAANELEKTYLEKYLDQTEAQAFDAVVSYEAKETRAALEESQSALLAARADEAARLSDPGALAAHVQSTLLWTDGVLKTRGAPEEARVMALKQNAGTLVKASFKNSLQHGTVSGTRAILERMKPALLTADYNEMDLLLRKAEEAQRALAARNERAAPSGGAPDALEQMYTAALELYQNNPSQLQAQVAALRQKPYLALGEMAEKGVYLKPKDLLSYADWAQKLLDDPAGTYGLEKIRTQQRLQAEYEEMEIDPEKDFKVGNRAVRKPETLAAFIGQLEGHVKAGDLNSEGEKQALQYINNLRAALGNMKITPSSAGGKETAAGAVVRQLDTLVNGARLYEETPSSVARSLMPFADTRPERTVLKPADGDMTLLEREPYEPQRPPRSARILTAQERGKIIEDTFKSMTSQGVDFDSEDPGQKQTAANLLQIQLHEALKNKFVIDRDDYNEVLHNGEIVRSYGFAPNPDLGASYGDDLKGYRIEENEEQRRLPVRDRWGRIETDGQGKPVLKEETVTVRRLVKRDANGAILHEQLL